MFSIINLMTFFVIVAKKCHVANIKSWNVIKLYFVKSNNLQVLIKKESISFQE